MEKLQILKDFLTKQRLSVTEERLKIASEVIKLDRSAFSVDDIHSRLETQGFVMAKSTVYRNLKLLRSAGLVEPAHKSRKTKDIYKNIDMRKVNCKVCCLGCGLEQEVVNEKLNELVLDICAEHDIELFGVMVRIEGRKNCPWHEKTAYASPKD